jgi:ribonuclease Z
MVDMAQNDSTTTTTLPPTAEAMRVVLLGTGGPELTLDRQGPSTVVHAGGQMFLFDVGRGMMQRAFEAGVPVRDITRVFLTHLHSDHICEMSDFWITGWFMLHRPREIEVWGPAGTTDYVENLRKAHAFDLRVRRDKSPRGKYFVVTEVEEGVIYERDGVTVTSFFVDHVEVKPALGFRVDYAGHSVLISGDTTLCEAVVQHGAGVDVMIHEVAAASDALYASNPATRHVIGNHTTPEQAAQVFNQTRPRLAVFNHVVRLGVGDADIMARTRRHYAGALEIGLDRMEISVGKTIKVFPPGPPKSLGDLIQIDQDEAATVDTAIHKL